MSDLITELRAMDIHRGTNTGDSIFKRAADTIARLEKQYEADGIRLRDEARYIRKLEAERDEWKAAYLGVLRFYKANTQPEYSQDGEVSGE